MKPPLPSRSNLENTIYMDIKQGRVVIELFPDIAPMHVERIKTARAAEVL